MQINSNYTNLNYYIYLLKKHINIALMSETHCTANSKNFFCISL